MATETEEPAASLPRSLSLRLAWLGDAGLAIDWPGERRALAVLLAAGVVLFGHYLIARESGFPLVVPSSVTDWLQRSVHADVAGLQRKLTGLLIMVAGAAVLFLALPRRRPAEPPLLALAAPAGQDRRLALLAAAAGLGLVLYPLVRFAGGHYSAELVAVWLIGVAWVASAVVYADVAAGADLRPRHDRWDALWLMLLTAGGGALLLYKLDSVPNSLWPDEGGFWVRSRAIAQGRAQPGLLEAGTYTFPVATNYFQAAFIKLLGEDLFAWRASSAFAAALAIPPTYLLGRSLFSRQIGIVAAVLLFTSPYFLAFSRLGYNNAQAIAPVVWSLYLLHAGLGRRSPALVFLAGAVAGLGFYTYQAARTAVLIALALLAAGALTRWLTWRRAAACAGLFLLPVVLLALPLSLYLRATDPDSVTDKLIEGLYFELFYGKSEFPAEKLEGPIAPLHVGQRGAAVHFNPDAHVRLIGRGLLRTSLTFDDPEIVRKHFIPGSLGGPAGSVLLLIGFVTVLSRYRERGSQLLGLWAFIVVLLLSGLSAFPPQWTRMVPLLPAMSLLAAVGVAVLAAAAARVASLPSLRIPLVVAAVLPLAAAGASGYFDRGRDVYASGMEDVIGFAAKEAPEASQFLWVYAFPLFADPPFLIREFPSRVEYASQGLPEFLEAPPAATGAPLTLFFDNAIGEAVVRRAREVYGPGETRLYIDPAGRVIGGSYTITSR